MENGIPQAAVCTLHAAFALRFTYKIDISFRGPPQPCAAGAKIFSCMSGKEGRRAAEKTEMFREKRSEPVVYCKSVRLQPHLREADGAHREE